MDSKVIVAIIFLFANTIGASPPPKLVPYILNGTIADMGQFPYFARIEAFYNENHWTKCGATIISENWLITVQRCAKREHEIINAYFGIESKTEYESFDVIEKDNIFILDDLSLLKTSKPIEFSHNVQPILLANIFMLRESIMNEEVEIVGVGYYKKDEPSRHVRFGKMRVFSAAEMFGHKACRQFWMEKRICLASEDGFTMAYYGDAGDPVIKEISDEIYLMAIMNTKLDDKYNTAIAIQPYIFWIAHVTGMYGQIFGLYM